MLFTRPAFLFCFLPAVLLVYTLAPQRLKNAVLAMASLGFYAFGEPTFVPWLVGSVALNYGIALLIEHKRQQRLGRAALVFGVVSDLALLAVFKYAKFIDSTLATVHGNLGIFDNVALPLGISFFTFHKISYKVDVYRGVAEAKRNPIDLALYILVFPQLIAGPIVRFSEMAPYLVSRVVSEEMFRAGLRRFVVGFAKKRLIADTLSVVATAAFQASGPIPASAAWLGLLCYTLEIYYDFSGYSDMAIGLAALFGFRFPENFEYPYGSATVTEFWRRWHMSLSRWFRDYLYIPLGGNRRSPIRTGFNLITVFLLCGLWHGAAWQFVAWGAYHGSLLLFERLGLVTKWPVFLSRAYTLLAVALGWTLFRSANLADAGVYFRSLFVGGSAPVRLPVDNLVLLALAFGAALSTPWYRSWLDKATHRLDARVASIGYAALFLACLGFVASEKVSPFIYFNF